MRPCARRWRSSVAARPGCCCRICCGAPSIDNVVVEQRSREYVEARVRAGVIEQGTSDLLRSLGLGSRMDREGFVHEGVTISNSRAPFRVDFKALVGRVGDGLRADRDPEGSLRLRRRRRMADRVRGRGCATARHHRRPPVGELQRCTASCRPSRPTTSPAATGSTESAGTRSRPTSGASTSGCIRSDGWVCCRRRHPSATS